MSSVSSLFETYPKSSHHRVPTTSLRRCLKAAPPLLPSSPSSPIHSILYIHFLPLVGPVLLLVLCIVLRHTHHHCPAFMPVRREQTTPSALRQHATMLPLRVARQSLSDLPFPLASARPLPSL